MHKQGLRSHAGELLMAHQFKAVTTSCRALARLLHVVLCAAQPTVYPINHCCGLRYPKALLHVYAVLDGIHTVMI